jgi:uncharacterized membrane protein YkoI
MEKPILDTAMSGRKSLRGWRAALYSALLLVLLGAGTSRAGDAHDHDRARRALESGEIVPLRTILERVERDYPGQIMEVELEREDARWRYEIKVLRRGGALVKLVFDARDGTQLDVNAQKDKDGQPGAAR